MIVQSTDVHAALRYRRKNNRLNAVGLLGGGGAALAKAPSAASFSPADITSVTKHFWLYNAASTTTIGTGISTWTDLFAQHNATQATGGAQPILTAADATLNGQKAALFDGVDDVLKFATFDPPAPPLWFWVIFKYHTWTSAKCIMGADSNAVMFTMRTAAPSFNLFNGTHTAVNGGSPVNTWSRAIASHTGTTATRLLLRTTETSGTSSGVLNGPAGTFALGARGDAVTPVNYSHISVACVGCLGGEPSELPQLETWGLANFGGTPFGV